MEKLYDEDPDAEEQKVPPLQLHNKPKTEEEMQIEADLNLNPPRAVAPRSQRFSTKSGFTEAQINLIRKLDLLGATDTAALAQLGDLIVVNVPDAASGMQLSEERLRGCLLSMPTARLIREEGPKGSLTGVAMSQEQWDLALESAHAG